MRYKDRTNDNFTSLPQFFGAKDLHDVFHGAIIESITVFVFASPRSGSDSLSSQGVQSVVCFSTGVNHPTR